MEGIDIVVIGCTSYYTRKYLVTDNCGNTAECFQTISWIFDLQPPIFTRCPPDIDLGCNPQPEDFADPSINVVSAVDLCGVVKVEKLEDTVENDGCFYKRIQTWKATDQCGNMSTCSRVIKYTLDDEPPVITECPPDIDFGCVGPDFEIPDPNPEDVIFEDDCGATVEVLPFIDIVVVNCTFQFGYVYVVTDHCGNADTCIQHISWIRDDQPPIFTQCPPDLDLGCNPDLDVIADPGINAVSAEDFCGEVDIERLEDEVIIDGCRYTRIQRWKATDRCGNMARCERKITYTLDDEPPVITECPPDIDFGCVEPGFQIPAPNPEDVIFEDDCGATVEVLPFIDIVVVNCTYQFGYVYVVTDRCGNADTCFQFISWTMDDAPPAFTYCPPNIDLGCNPDEDEILEAINDDIIVEDFCGLVEVDFNETRVEDGCMILITQTWTAKDQCGNTSTCSRTIKYTIDTEQPQVISCPESSHLGCLQIAPFFAPFDPNDYDVTDNCGNVNFSHYDQIIDSETEECLRTFRRFVTIYDDCGNLNSCITEYSWYEVNEPQLDIPFPDDLSLVCQDAPPAPDFGDRNCGIGIPVLLQELIIGDCTNQNCTIFRVWSKKDCFGTINIHVQTIVLICQDITTLKDNINVRNIRENVDANFKVFPNPGFDVLNIESNLMEKQPYQILIMDQAGKLVLQKNNIDFGTGLETIDVEDLTPGIYYIELRAEDVRSIQKWIKAK